MKKTKNRKNRFIRIFIIKIKIQTVVYTYETGVCINGLTEYDVWKIKNK